MAKTNKSIETWSDAELDEQILVVQSEREKLKRVAQLLTLERDRRLLEAKVKATMTVHEIATAGIKTSTGVH